MIRCTLPLAAILALGCGSRAQPQYVEAPQCPYEGDNQPVYDEASPPSEGGDQPTLVSPAAHRDEAPATCVAHALCSGESCCARIALPAGTLTDARAGEVRVDAFSLDKYELTVGRVRAFYDAGAPAPAPGTVVGRTSTGAAVTWQAGWRLPSRQGLAQWERYDTFRTGRDTLPKNFLDAYTAMAVCAFDGGRLPSDAEWRYAARGGEEARAYPWGAERITPEHAVYNCSGDGDPSCSLADLLDVGSRPKGAGRWGHQDLAGSVFEWTADAVAGDEAVSRGGGFCYIGGVDRRARQATTADNVRRDAPSTASHMVGARCAFDLPSERVITASR